MPDYATNPVDIVKIALMAWLGVKAINAALRMIGAARYTTTGA